MRTSPQLSSSMTFLHEWVFPALLLLSLPIFVQSALLGPRVEWIFAIGWGIACISVALVSWPIKLITIEGDFFTIFNYFSSYRVPISHLANVTESNISRLSTIYLHFEPPTPYGKRIRIIPPHGFFTNDFDEVMAFLRSLVSDHKRLGAKMPAN